ncbi:hypothetical protein EMIT0158MI4_80324 [Burkholderia ambifaria]
MVRADRVRRLARLRLMCVFPVRASLRRCGPGANRVPGRRMLSLYRNGSTRSIQQHFILKD